MSFSSFPQTFRRRYPARGLPAQAIPSWRWVLLAAMVLAAATFGALYIVTVQAQETNGATTGLTLSSDEAGTLTVSWDAASPAPTDYRVNWAKADESYPSWTDDAGNRHPEGTSVELTGLEQGAEYKVRVRARYYSGENEDSSWSGPWAEVRGRVSAPAPAVPAAPTLTGAAVTPEGQVTLLWQDPSDDSITGYQALRGPDAGSLAVIEDDTGSSGTSYTDASPPAGQTHTYAVKARSAGGLSPLSNTLTATVPEEEPELVTSRHTATDGVLVSNLGQAASAFGTSIANIVIFDTDADGDPTWEEINDRRSAQEFTTGPHPLGYHVEEVQLYLRSEPAFAHRPAPVVTIRSAGGVVPNDAVDEVVATFTAPADIFSSNATTFQLYTFTPDGGVPRLWPATTYWLFVEGALTRHQYLGSQGHRVELFSLRAGVTTGDAEDAGPLTGWQIGNSRVSTIGLRGASWQTQSSALRIGIRGHEAARSLVEEEGQDRRADIYTTGYVSVDGDAAQGTLTKQLAQRANGLWYYRHDEDWYEVELEADTDYEFRFEGVKYYRVAIYDSAGTRLAGDSGSMQWPSRGGRMPYRPTVAGTYYVGMSAPSYRNLVSNPTSAYTLRVVTDDHPAGAPQPGRGGNDVPSSETVRINRLGNEINSEIDKDWIKYELEAGVRYQFIFTTPCTFVAVMEGIYDSNGARVSGQDRVEKECFASRVFTPPDDGFYYLALTSRFRSGVDSTSFPGVDGTLYAWSEFQKGQGEDGPNDDLPGPNIFTTGYVTNDGETVEGKISEAGDVDWYAVWLDNPSTITLQGYLPAGETSNDLDGKLRVSVHRLFLDKGHTQRQADATATAGAGSQRVTLTYSRPHRAGPGIYWIAVSARDGGTGAYRLSNDNNVPARGALQISGERKVGETLTTDTDDISDPDGLASATFRHQWQRLDGGAATNITGATNDSYTLTNDDVGKRIRLQVQFTDDDGNPESLTGPATSLVVAAPRLLVGNFDRLRSQSINQEVTTGFETGPNPMGYSIESIKFRRRVESPGTNSYGEFRLYNSTTASSANARQPLHRILKVSGPSSVSGRTLTFEPPTKMKLNANATYHAVMSRSQGGSLGCQVANTGQASGSLAGFSIFSRVWIHNSITGPEGGFDDGITCALEIRGLELVSSSFVTRIQFTSTPAQDGMYATGERIEITATLSESVVPVGPAPMLLLQVGANLREMAYVASASTPTSWVFRYTVTAADRDDDGVEVPRNGLRGYADADLSYPALGDDSKRPGHAVNAQPRLVDHQVTSTPVAPIWYGPGEQIQFTMTFSLPVTVTGDPQLEFNVSIPDPANEFASYASGSGTRELVFAYTVTTADDDQDGIWWDADSLRLDSDDEITGVYNGLDATLDHSARNKLENHRVDQNPRAVSQTVTSSPTRGTDSDTYGAGDAITFAVVFNQTVTVTGTPQLRFSISSGTDDEYAEYVSGSGSDTLAFSYTVLATDSDTDGIFLYDDPLTYDSGESIVGTVNMMDAVNEGVGKEGKPPGDTLVDGSLSSMTQRADNTPATGGPGITGTPLAGETLTATTSGIEDDDGLTGAVFSYQWIRHDLGTATDTDIDGATADTYTVTAADEGKAIKVRVTFTDDAGNEESLTSNAVIAAPPPAQTRDEVEEPAPLTASVHDKPGSHDGQSTFTFELRLSEAPRNGFSYVTLRDHAFTVTGGELTGARRLEQGENLRWQISVEPDSGGDVTIVLPATTDCEANGAICTEDGRMLSERVEITVSGPGQ